MAEEVQRHVGVRRSDVHFAPRVDTPVEGENRAERRLRKIKSHLQMHQHLSLRIGMVETLVVRPGAVAPVEAEDLQVGGR